MKVLRLTGIIVTIVMSVQCGQAADATITEAKSRVIDAVWQYHLAVIKAVVATHEKHEVTMDLTEFGRAIDVIESLTNIPSNTGTRVGRLPTPELPRAIRRWEQWYAQNRSRLDVGIDGCSLRIKR